MANQLATCKREAPWIGIGVSGHWTDYREALHDAQLDFEVEAKEALVEFTAQYGKYMQSDPNTKVGSVTLSRYDPVPGVQVNVMKDSDKILGCVSSQYGIVQNDMAFKLLEPFTQLGGVITNAGMTEQGLVFMVLRMRREMMQGDEWEFDVMCTNSFNGNFPCALMMVPMRIVCQNMYRKLMGGSSDSLLHVRHCSMSERRLEAAGKATGNIMNYISAFGQTLGMARNRRLGMYDMQHDILPMLFPYPKPGGDKYAMGKERVDRLRQDFIDRYYEAPDNAKFHGTGLGFINAYYDYLSHGDPGKCMPGSWADRRFSNIVSGTNVKMAAIKEAM